MVDRTVFDAVKAVLDQFDPEGLLAMGAPSDEYSPEAADFAERLRRGDPMTPDLVTRVWIGRFYEDCGLVQQDLAAPLAEALNRITPTPSRPF
jgi:hypothetical protein